MPNDGFDAAAIPREIRSFIEAARDPALIEPGEEPIPLAAGCYSVGDRGGRFWIEAWSGGRNLARRVTGIRESTRGRLELAVERFGKRRGTLLLVDRARPRNHEVRLTARRRVFLEEFRAMIHRQFSGWQISGLTTGADLEHSLSPAYPRAFAGKGSTAWALLGAPRDAGSADGALTFGLIWLDYLRRRKTRHVFEGLALFLPAGQHSSTCLRLQYLDRTAARYQVFIYSPEGFESALDTSDYGNLDSRLDACADGGAGAAAAIGRPEAWLEHQVRADVARIDAGLLPAPVYGQVPAFSGTDRGVLDLLAVCRDGRLAVIELKATADLHLPLQALDYWVRVRHHAVTGEFTARGYFPGLWLRPDPPRLILVAPALEFHPTTETILRHLAPNVPVERVGLASDWQQELRVVFRTAGARSPGL